MVNMIMINLPMRFNRMCPKTWDNGLPYLQHCYNQEVHSYIRMSPIVICLDFFPQTPFDIHLFKLLERT